MFWHSTTHGIGLAYDSVWYVAAARNLVAGAGIGRYNCVEFKPLTLYPPMYSIALAAISSLGTDVLTASRILGTAGYSLTILLGGTIAGRVAKSLWATGLGACLLLLSAPLLQVSSWALSEHLFLPLALASVLGLGLFLEHSSTRDFALACLFAALATLTRYVGIVAIVAGVLTTIACAKSSGRRLWVHAGLLAACGMLPLGAWSLFNAVVVGTATNRRLAFHPLVLQAWGIPLRTIASWFVPDRLNTTWIQGAVISGLALILLATLVWSLKRVALDARRYCWALLLCLFAILYPLMVIATATFLTPGVEALRDRLLIPLHVVVLIMVSSGIAALWRSPRKSLRAIALAAGLLMLTLYGVRYPGLIRGLASDGQGSASAYAMRSETAQALRLLNKEVIFTNDIQTMYFVADKRSCVIPTASSDIGIEEMRSILQASDGVVVIFGRLSREFLPIEQVINGLDVIQILPEAVVYGHPPAGS